MTDKNSDVAKQKTITVTQSMNEVLAAYPACDAPDHDAPAPNELALGAQHGILLACKFSVPNVTPATWPLSLFSPTSASFRACNSLAEPAQPAPPA